MATGRTCTALLGSMLDGLFAHWAFQCTPYGVDLAPDADRLPIAATVRPPGRWPMALLSLLAVGIPGVVWWCAHLEGPAASEAIGPVLTPAFALLAVVGLLYALTVRENYHIDADGVSFSRRSILGVHEWREPMGAYKGVVGRQELRGSSRSQYMVYSAELVHSAKKRRNVILYASRKPAELQPKVRHYAALLGFRLTVGTAERSSQRHLEGERSPGAPEADE